MLQDVLRHSWCFGCPLLGLQELLTGVYKGLVYKGNHLYGCSLCVILSEQEYKLSERDLTTVRYFLECCVDIHCLSVQTSHIWKHCSILTYDFSQEQQDSQRRFHNKENSVPLCGNVIVKPWQLIWHKIVLCSARILPPPIPTHFWCVSMCWGFVLGFFFFLMFLGLVFFFFSGGWGWIILHLAFQPSPEKPNPAIGMKNPSLGLCVSVSPPAVELLLIYHHMNKLSISPLGSAQLVQL